MKDAENPPAPGPLRALLVGCGGMGRGQGKILKTLAEYELVGACDMARDRLDQAVAELGVPAFTDFGEALRTTQPDVVAVCTGNCAHAPLTIQAAEWGVRGIYCEKPMAVSWGEAQAMMRACRNKHVFLVINHQRRLGADLRAMRRLMAEEAIGRVRRIVLQCAGDMLSDATHLIDSLLFLMGDDPIKWVAGSLFRDLDEGTGQLAAHAPVPREVPAGRRFGHLTETGGMAVVQFASGVRAEIFCGDLRADRSAYHTIEVFGDRGHLWRTGDFPWPNLFLADGTPGDRTAGLDGWTLKPIPCEPGQTGPWRVVDVEPDRLPLAEPGSGRGSIATGYRLLARSLHFGEPHPMAGEEALRVHELLMAIYESGRLRQRLVLPLAQDEFPLNLMYPEAPAKAA